MKRVGGALAVVVAAVVLFSCGDDNKPSAAAPVGVFTGKLPGSEALIGVSVGKANITAWVCNGADGLALRFSSPRLGDGFDVTLPSGFRMAGSVNGKQLVGALGGPTGSTQFSLALAGPKGGIFTLTETVDGEEQSDVWVVLNDGTEQGAGVTAGGVKPARKRPPAAARSNPSGGGGSFQGQFGQGQGSFNGQGFGGQFSGGQQGQGGFGGQFQGGGNVQGGGQAQFGQGGGVQFGQGGGQIGQVGGGQGGGKGFGFGG